MTVALERFATGDTDYVGKHNSNVEQLEATVNGLLALINSTFGGAATAGQAHEALFGPITAVIGSGSYACSGAGTTLTVQPGACWHYTTKEIRAKATSTALSFSGLTAATYYVSVDASGTPVRQSTDTDALYSVVWTGSAFGAITRVAAITWGHDDWDRAQISAALSDTYERLDDRLEAGEAVAVSAQQAITDHLADSDPHMAQGVWTVLDRDLTAPPGSPAAGDVYIPASGSTGGWAGADGQLARWDGSVWVIIPPAVGWLAYVVDEEVLSAHKAAGWSAGTAV